MYIIIVFGNYPLLEKFIIQWMNCALVCVSVFINEKKVKVFSACNNKTFDVKTRSIFFFAFS